MTIKNRGTGAGGAKTNLNGIKFEEDKYLKEWIEKEDYTLVPVKVNTNRSAFYEIRKNNKLVGYYGRQGQVYNALRQVNEKHFSKKWISKVFSKKIHPDAFIISLNPRRLTIFEKKWQNRSGSVDEKVQTAPFKLQMFEKLLRGANISCQYQYILSSWFKAETYRNVKEYYQNNKQINVWVDEDNLNDLDINKFIN